MSEAIKFILPDDKLPKCWYNFTADLPQPAKGQVSAWRIDASARGRHVGSGAPHSRQKRLPNKIIG
jgi:hypothetical protein